MEFLAAATVGRDVLRHRRIAVRPDTPRGLTIKVYHDLAAAHYRRPVDWANLKDTLSHLDDSWMAPLLRIVYRHSEKNDDANLAKIHQATLGFRYGISQPGEDGRCYWSENHQLLYACTWLSRFASDARSEARDLIWSRWSACPAETTAMPATLAILRA